MKRETAREDVPRMRVRGPGARLQGRSHARAVSDRARQDSPESIVGDVRATPAPARHGDQAGAPARDRKSTRLNSSHSQISYAVFCLKKKKETRTHAHDAQQRRPATDPRAADHHLKHS